MKTVPISNVCVCVCLYGCVRVCGCGCDVYVCMWVTCVSNATCALCSCVNVWGVGGLGVACMSYVMWPECVCMNLYCLQGLLCDVYQQQIIKSCSYKKFLKTYWQNQLLPPICSSKVFIRKHPCEQDGSACVDFVWCGCKKHFKNVNLDKLVNWLFHFRWNGCSINYFRKNNLF